MRERKGVGTEAGKKKKRGKGRIEKRRKAGKQEGRKEEEKSQAPRAYIFLTIKHNRR